MNSLELYEDEQAQAAGVFVQLPQRSSSSHSDGKSNDDKRASSAVAIPFNLSAFPAIGPTSHVPLVDEHRQEILAMLAKL